MFLGLKWRTEHKFAILSFNEAFVLYILNQTNVRTQRKKKNVAFILAYSIPFFSLLWTQTGTNLSGSDATSNPVVRNGERTSFCYLLTLKTWRKEPSYDVSIHRRNSVISDVVILYPEKRVHSLCSFITWNGFA